MWIFNTGLKKDKWKLSSEWPVKNWQIPLPKYDWHDFSLVFIMYLMYLSLVLLDFFIFHELGWLIALFLNILVMWYIYWFCKLSFFIHFCFDECEIKFLLEFECIFIPEGLRQMLCFVNFYTNLTLILWYEWHTIVICSYVFIKYVWNMSLCSMSVNTARISEISLFTADLLQKWAICWIDQ